MKIGGGITKFGSLFSHKKIANLGWLNEIAFEKFNARFRQLSLNQQKIVRQIRISRK